MISPTKIAQLSVYVRYEFGGPLVDVVGQKSGFQEVILTGENTYGSEVEGKKFSAGITLKEIMGERFLPVLQINENATKAALNLKKEHAVEYHKPQKIALSPDTTVELKVDDAEYASFEMVKPTDLRALALRPDVVVALCAGGMEAAVGDAKVLSLKEAKNLREAALLILGYTRGAGCPSVILVTSREKLDDARILGMNLRSCHLPAPAICVQP